MYATSHKKPFVPSVGGIGFTMSCIGRGQSPFCETSVMVTDGVIDPFRWMCELL